jgi:RNA polymerase sigma-70 factor (ECF subfamily)
MLDNSLSQPVATTDGELVHLIRQGSHEAFTEIVGRHTQRFFALAFRTLQNKSDAEDVVQACFIKFWQRPQLWQEGKSQFTTWFYRVVINACRDLQRRSPKLAYESIDDLDALLPRTQSEELLAEEIQNQTNRQRYVELALSKLIESQREAINLVVYCELPQRQAAEILGLSVKALESLLIRAKRNLKQTIKEYQLADDEVNNGV